MNKVWMFKGDASMHVNDVEEGLQTLAAAGWSPKAPKGWKEPAVYEEGTETEVISSAELRTLLATNETLSNDLAEANQTIEKLRSDIEALTKGKAADKEKPASKGKEK